jgi:hypothetical protein
VIEVEPEPPLDEQATRVAARRAAPPTVAAMRVAVRRENINTSLYLAPSFRGGSASIETLHLKINGGVETVNTEL